MVIIMKGERRYKVLRFLQELFRIEEGRVLPWYLKTVAYCMFPSRIIWDFNPWFKYDISTDVITMGEYQISVRFLIDLIYNLPENRWFRVRDRSDGIITMEQYIDANEPPFKNYDHDPEKEKFVYGLFPPQKDEGNSCRSEGNETNKRS